MSRPPESTKILYEEMVAIGGGKFRAFWDAEIKGIEPMVLFDSPQTKTTLALPISKMSAAAVRREIHISDELHAFLGDLKNHAWSQPRE